MSLPPLPAMNDFWTVDENIYSEDQVKAYGQLCRQQALEEAAALVDANADRCVASNFVPEMILRSNANAIRNLI